MRTRFRQAAVGLGALLSFAIAAAVSGALVASGGSAAVIGGVLAGVAFLAGMLAGRRLAPSDAVLEADALELEAARGDAVTARRDAAALQRSVAHDLRSPLGAILNFVAVLEEDHRDRLSDEARGILGRVRRAAESGIVLLDGISRLSRVSREPLAPQRVDVESVVRAAFEELPGRTGVELTVGSLPAAIADPALLRVAFSELFSNAVKFSARQEKPHVGVGGRRESDGTALFWVADDGIGFDPRSAGRLFGVFERLHSRDEYPGAGVGLAIVRHVAERHGGTAWAEGEPDRGARFFIRLPAAKETR